MWSKIAGEFIDIIEWTDDSNNTLVYRFERYDNEIKNGAKLIVRESQTAVLISEGILADDFGPGTYILETKNIPVLSTIKGWSHGFSSPFKAEVYFINLRRFTDLKWGTKNPLTLRDPEFGPVRLRAFGSYEIRVNNVKTFLMELVGTDGHFTMEEISNQLRNLIITRFSDVVAESKIPVLDMAANYNELGAYVTDEIAPDFAAYGIELTKLLVENISLPPAVEEALDRRTSMGIVGDLNKYTQFQAAESMRSAAENPSGGANEGIGLGMGFAMAQQINNAMTGQQQPPAAPETGEPPPTASPPPPPPAADSYHIAENGQQRGPFVLDDLKKQAQSGQFTEESLVWKPGMSGWQKASEVEELASLFTRSAPPPLPGGDSYYVAINGQQSGPFAIAMLQQQAQNGQLNRSTLVWKQGMDGWQAAGEVVELSDLFSHIPPPPPPPMTPPVA